MGIPAYPAACGVDRHPERRGEQGDVVGRADVERDRPDAEDQGLDAEPGPGRGLLPHLLDGADEPTDPPLVEGHARRAPRAGCSPGAARSGGPGRARSRRRARRAPATATPSPGSRPTRRTPRSSTSSRSRYCSGVHAQHVFHPSACSATSRSSRSPLPPMNTGGRGCCTAAGRFARGGGAVERAVERDGPPPGRASRSTIVTASRSRAGARPAAEVHADRRVLGLVPSRADADVEPAAGEAVEAWRAPWRAPSPAGAPRTARACRAGRASRRARARRASRSARTRPRRSGLPPYLPMSKKRWSDSHSESKPSRRRPSARCAQGPQRSGDSPGTEKSYCGSANPMRTQQASRSRARTSVSERGSNLARSLAWGARGAWCNVSEGRTPEVLGPRSPGRAGGRPCSTSTPTRTTTGRVHDRGEPSAATTEAAVPAGSPPRPSTVDSTDHDGVHPGSGCSTSCRSSRSTALRPRSAVAPPRRSPTGRARRSTCPSSSTTSPIRRTRTLPARPARRVLRARARTAGRPGRTRARARPPSARARRSSR